ncbi:hypothetical protein BDP27DRAFT_1439345 [Rhodocollybia butyracea]|uniref:Oxidoreductase AflY n=1 Tax=Rhodocollybia butyracea TaxID=206335 RepID=A0A9P5P3I3_9AGAR|nr:hypothetical protein BDP27DRAFT_1439345 [Rhodocollybia butyracea]
MAPVSHRILRNGVLGLPKTSPASKVLTEDLLWKDAQSNHCYFNQAGFHNHLSHHLLAAYDLGTSPGLLQKKYDQEARIQRPIILEEKDKGIRITDENWVQYVGNQNAYSGFVTFFENKVASAGVVRTLEEFVFSPAANEKGKSMLVRLMSGILHPFILVGYGLEFGYDALVSTGLASAAMHNPDAPELFDKEKTDASAGLTALEILELSYKSPVLKPAVPYDPDAIIPDRIKAAVRDGRSEEIQALCAKFHVDESLDNDKMLSKVEELVWVSVLLLFATGKEGKKPRLGFFLMHLVTSSLFLRSYIGTLENPAHKAAIIKAFLPSILLYTIARGRPTIKPHLLMTASDKPRPPYVSGSPYKKTTNSGIGSALDDEDYNPWPAMIEASQYAFQGIREYNSRGVIGAFKRDDPSAETHTGISQVDGTIFVRAAGMLMDFMGWSAYGQPERDDWDRSALGWDEAWKNEV